jgi:hypothetical protein
VIDISAKDKLIELQNLLNSIVPHENLQSEKVLNISRELDILIIESYSEDESTGKENKA